MQNSSQLYFDQHRLICTGAWHLATLRTLEKLFARLPLPTPSTIIIDGAAINKIDSAGAWLICKWQTQLTQRGFIIQYENFSPAALQLLTLIAKHQVKEKDLPHLDSTDGLTRFGKQISAKIQEFLNYLVFIGEVTLETLRILRTPIRWRWPAFMSNLDKNGYQALAIIGLLSFMIGVVLTYQMGVQLRNYGANIYIVDLLGLSILREFGPLLTAIMIAGRTGSAYTAQLGLMKANQEIDALNTMGITAIELLILPRILSLTLALPLLTIWADIFGVIGGMVMANNMLHLSWYDFLHRFQHQIPLRALIIGLGKAPVFGLIIGSISCFEGMAVRGNADSIGKNTTKSVVLAIFFLMLADALFSILFNKLHL